jgi:hypothetical protein
MRTVVLSVGLSLVSAQPLHFSNTHTDSSEASSILSNLAASDVVALRGGISFDTELLRLPAAAVMTTPITLATFQPSAPQIETGAMPQSDADEQFAPSLMFPPEDVPKLSREEVCEHIASAAQAYRLPVNFFGRLIWQESGFDPNNISHAGARGIAQFMPETAALVGLANPFDPVSSLTASAQFLRSLHERFGNLGLAAAAYNAGPQRVMNWISKKERRLPAETRDYVLNITGHSADAWRSMTPPAFALQASGQTRCGRLPSTTEDEVAQTTEPKSKLVLALLSAPPPDTKPQSASRRRGTDSATVAGQSERKRVTRLAAASTHERHKAAEARRPVKLALWTGQKIAAMAPPKQKPIRVAALSKRN